MPFLIHFGGISYLEYYSLLFLEGTLRIMTDFCANLKSIMTIKEVLSTKTFILVKTFTIWQVKLIVLT